MKFSPQDLRTIREFAMLTFMDRAIPKDKPDNFLALCYTEAVLHFLESKGLKVVKDDTKEAEVLVFETTHKKGW